MTAMVKQTHRTVKNLAIRNWPEMRQIKNNRLTGRALPCLIWEMHALAEAYLDWLRPPFPTEEKLLWVDIKMIVA